MSAPKTVKAMVIFQVRCDLWCLYSCDFVISENNVLLFIMHSMHSETISIFDCFIVFIMPLNKNDLMLFIYRRLIAPSLYYQIT